MSWFLAQKGVDSCIYYIAWVSIQLFPLTSSDLLHRAQGEPDVLLLI